MQDLAQNFQTLVKAAVDTRMDILRQCQAIKTTADAIFERVPGFANNAHLLTAAGEGKTRREARYDAQYAEEVQYNIDLNKFAFNLKTSYRRQNTASDQLVHVPKSITSERRPFLASEEGEEVLPLGREFQHFVRTFLCYEHQRNGFSVDHMRAEVASMVALIRKALKSTKKLSEQERIDRENLTIKAMQVLRAMMHNQLCLKPEEFLATDSFVAAINRDVDYVQNALDHYGIMQAVVPLLASTNTAISSEVRRTRA